MKILHKLLLSLILTAVTLSAAFPMEAAASSTPIYINDSSSTLSGSLNGAYAIGGGGGVSKLPGTYAYAMTGDGLATVGYSPVVIPDHLSVTGSVAVKYPRLRVGLYYYDGSSSIRNPTLDCANLENAVGSGYSFGWYDSSRNFNEVGGTGETKLTMAMDKNLDISAGHLGCYHILLSGTYSDFASASAAAAQYPDGFPAYYNGVYSVLLGSYDSAPEAQSDAAARGIDGTAYSASQYCVTVARTSDARILFEFDCGSEKKLAVKPKSDYGKAVTWFKGYKYYGDFEYVRRTGEKLTVINVVDIEDYVKGILPYEMSASWPTEALKAQAVCARTYAVNSINSNNSTYGFDVTNDTYSQAYRGTTLANANSDSAVDSTAGQYITYNGRTISAMYYSSNGGGSENSENVFSNTVAYLRGKTDPFEAKSDSINGKSHWSFTFSKSELAGIVNGRGGSLSNVASLELAYSDSGNVVGMKFTDTAGRTHMVSKSACYSFSTSALGLYSIHYTIEDKGSYIEFKGGGWGHSVGMSQFGAYAMAKYYSYTYDQIINFYYTGVSLSAGYTG
ncbi:MAG: SpoIID/LytB domain-containing protein [Oscillospiraceae bacterium]